MSDQPPSPPDGGNQDDAPQPQSEHLNIKVTDNNNEVFFKIKRTTQLKKLMDAFCERQGKSFTSVRFLFDGTRVNPSDNPEMVSWAQHARIRLDDAASNTEDSSKCKTATPSRSTRSRLVADAEASPLNPPDSIAYTTATTMTTRQGIPWSRLDETKRT